MRHHTGLARLLELATPALGSLSADRAPPAHISNQMAPTATSVFTRAVLRLSSPTSQCPLWMEHGGQWGRALAANCPHGHSAWKHGQPPPLLSRRSHPCTVGAPFPSRHPHPLWLACWAVVTACCPHAACWAQRAAHLCLLFISFRVEHIGAALLLRVF